MKHEDELPYSRWAQPCSAAEMTVQMQALMSPSSRSKGRKPNCVIFSLMMILGSTCRITAAQLWKIFVCGPATPQRLPNELASCVCVCVSEWTLRHSLPSVTHHAARGMSSLCRSKERTLSGSARCLHALMSEMYCRTLFGAMLTRLLKQHVRASRIRKPTS